MLSWSVKVTRPDDLTLRKLFPTTVFVVQGVEGCWPCAGGGGGGSNIKFTEWPYR